MAISFVQYHEAFSNAATSITLNVPTGAAAGDLLLASITSDGSKVSSTANDFSWGSNLWVQLYNSVFNDFWQFWRVMESGDTSWTFTTTASSKMYGAIVAYNESGTANWCVSTTGVEEDTSSSTATGRVDVESGIGISGSWATGSGVMTGITHDVGTSRVSGVNAAGTSALALYEHTGPAHTAFTSTVAGSPPNDHWANSIAFYTLPTAVFYDPADAIDASGTRTGYTYKGRDTAAADTVGAY